jgi:hypothetical protein
MIQRNAPRRSRIQPLALAAVLGFCLLALSQCRHVSDRLTGVRIDSPPTLSARRNCTHHCNAEFKAELLDEEHRHRAGQRACGRDAGCRKDEDRTHAINLRELQNRSRRCKWSCYNEGAGNAGA